MTATAHRSAAPARPRHLRSDDVRARRRHLRLVRKPDRAPRKRRRVILGVVGSGVVAIVFTIALTHVFMAQAAFELAREEQLLVERRAENEDLELAVALMETPERMRREATQRLDMVPPAAIHYLESGSADEHGAAANQAPISTSIETNSGNGTEQEAPAGDDPPSATAETDAASTGPEVPAQDADPDANGPEAEQRTP